MHMQPRAERNPWLPQSVLHTFTPTPNSPLPPNAAGRSSTGKHACERGCHDWTDELLFPRSLAFCARQRQPPLHAAEGQLCCGVEGDEAMGHASFPRLNDALRRRPSHAQA